MQQRQRAFGSFKTKKDFEEIASKMIPEIKI